MIRMVINCKRKDKDRDEDISSDPPSEEETTEDNKQDEEEENCVDFTKIREAQRQACRSTVSQLGGHATKVSMKASSNSGLTRRREMDESSSEVKPWTDTNTEGSEITRETNEKMSTTS